MLMALYHKWPNSRILQLKLAPASTCAYLTPIPQPLKDAWPGPASKIDLISINKTFRTPNPEPRRSVCRPSEAPGVWSGIGPLPAPGAWAHEGDSPSDPAAPWSAAWPLLLLPQDPTESVKDTAAPATPGHPCVVGGKINDLSPPEGRLFCTMQSTVSF